MNEYQLYWGYYKQWSVPRKFDTDEEAKADVIQFAKDHDADLSEFSLIKLVRIKLED